MARLAVVPTPIGNLEDITVRALRVFREVSLILAEDTRQARKLLSHYSISTPLLSYHQHNKRERLERVLRALEAGDVALMSNAGMPAISDPGFELIQAALHAGVEVDVLPGASAVVTAVVAAALPARGFLFAGFLPRRSGHRRRALREIFSVPYSLVLFEAPHRLVDTLLDAREVLGDRQIVAARELTKVHQQIVRGTITELIQRYEHESPRGEFTLVVAGAEPSQGEEHTWKAQEDLKHRRREGQDARTAVAEVGRKYGLGRNEAYRLWLESAQDAQT